MVGDLSRLARENVLDILKSDGLDKTSVVA